MTNDGHHPDTITRLSLWILYHGVNTDVGAVEIRDDLKKQHLRHHVHIKLPHDALLHDRINHFDDFAMLDFGSVRGSTGYRGGVEFDGFLVHLVGLGSCHGKEMSRPILAVVCSAGHLQEHLLYIRIPAKQVVGTR